VCVWLTRACREVKLTRFHLDAGRVLFLKLEIGGAFQHFSKAEIDPRELMVRVYVFMYVCISRMLRHACEFC
jgi:hypothetical protein